MIFIGWKSLWIVLLLVLTSPIAVAGSLPSHFFGMHILHAINGTPWPDVPFSSIRLWDTDGTGWPQLNPARGKYDWFALDKWLALAEKHHVQVLYTFGRVPSWANGGQKQSVPPRNLDDWDAFVRALVRHTKGRIKAYELWNEPNDPNFWSGGTETLLAMAQRAYHIIKSEQPDAIVTTPSPTWRDSTPAQWLDQYLAADGGKAADVIAIHGYVGIHPENLVGNFQSVWKVLEKHHIHKPLWDTESSWGRDDKLPDPTARANYLVRSYLLHASQGVQRFYWYAWDGSNDGKNPANTSWGTLWNAHRLDSTIRAYKTVHHWLSAADPPFKCKKTESAWRCPANSASEIVWNPSGKDELKLDLQYDRIVDLNGTARKIPAKDSVPIGPSPVLLLSR